MSSKFFIIFFNIIYLFFISCQTDFIEKGWISDGSGNDNNDIKYIDQSNNKKEVKNVKNDQLLKKIDQNFLKKDLLYSYHTRDWKLFNKSYRTYKKYYHDNFLDKFGRDERFKTILVILPLTGEYSVIGKILKNGLSLTNSLIDNPFNLIFFDTESDIFYKIGDLYEVVEKLKPKYIIGGLYNDDTKMIIPIAARFGINFFTFSSDETLTKNYKKLYIQSITAENSAYIIAKYSLEELFYRKFAIFFPMGDVGEKYAKYFSKFIKDGGGEIVNYIGFDPDKDNLDKPISVLVDRSNPYKRDDFKKYLAKAKNIKNKYRKHRYIERAKMKLKAKYEFEAIFLPVSYKKVNYIVPLLAGWDIPLLTNDPTLMEQTYHKYLNKNQKYVQVLGVPLWYNFNIFKNKNKYINGVIFPTPIKIDYNDQLHPFNELFKNIDRGDKIYEALTYDLLMIIEYVFENNKKIDNYDGVMGSYIFHNNQFFKIMDIVVIDGETFIKR